MPAHLKIGQHGERIAVAYVSQYCRILALNWKSGRKEIDIIASRNGCIYFIEVKTRSSARYGWPEDAVGFRKKENIQAAAEAYLLESDLAPVMIRFDIIAITLTGTEHDLVHLKDVF